MATQDQDQLLFTDVPAAPAPPPVIYDLRDAKFVDYFIGITGCNIRSCSCGWAKVRDVLANPAHVLDPVSFQYEATGLPVPVAEGEAVIRSWMSTRSKLQAFWDVYVGRKTLSAAYHEQFAAPV